MKTAMGNKIAIILSVAVLSGCASVGGMALMQGPKGDTVLCERKYGAGFGQVDVCVALYEKAGYKRIGP